MHAMILAAGRGERMKPLTKDKPKPMLEINDKPMLQYHIENLAAAGIKNLIINHAIHGKQIQDYFGTGDQFNICIEYSIESDHPLDTGGGIFKALPQLGQAPFIVVNGDIWTDYPYKELINKRIDLAHLVLVDNPVHHSRGDFCLTGQKVSHGETNRLTFSGIGIYHPDLFQGCRNMAFPLTPLLDEAISKNRVSGEYYRGRWIDVGTPARLQEIRDQF